jgi:poly(A) polymerase
LRFRYSSRIDGRPVKRALVYTRNEHGINFDDVDSQAVFIIERLRANGFETYIVGGAVRDLILGKKPKDFDIVSGANPSRIKRIFRNSRIIGRRFRLVHVYFGSKIFEVSTFRSLKDGPTSNTYGTIEEDVLRRDFSLNALFYDPLEQIVVDYVGGMKDIRKRRVRPIIPLPAIFMDDPVRMIRAVKYATTTDFKLPLLVRRKIKKQARLLEPVSPSRLTEEIIKIIHSPSAARIVENLEAFGLYAYLQPNASRLMKENAAFRSRYLKSLAGIRQDAGGGALSAPLAAPLAALIRDYLEDKVPWGEGAAECFKDAFLAARGFVLPMNPPRMELDRGVRLVFEEHGVTVKKSRLLERVQGRPGGGEGFPADAENSPEKPGRHPRADSAETGNKRPPDPRKRRRGRKRGEEPEA